MSSKRREAERKFIDAVLADDLPAVRALLDAGVDVNARDVEHLETPLMLARSEPMILLLIERGADVNAKDNRGCNVLVFGNYPDLLLNAGADPNNCDLNGETPLFFAIALADYDKVNTLIAHGAKVNIASNDGETPLRLARNHGLLHLVDVLKSAGATD